MTKVFVSSTIYDLIDVRRELFEELREMGFDPYLSDAKESGFAIGGEPTINTIETCLVNLRQSDIVIVVLSQRYGHPLAAPYNGLSPTHCEYREAKSHNKRIYFYVRDQLDADYISWIKNARPPDFKLRWLQGENDKKLFGLIEEHRSQGGAGGTASENNWVHTFATSVDLCTDIRRHLSQVAHAATAQKLIESGRVPLVLASKIELTNIHGPNENKGIMQFLTHTTLEVGVRLINAGSQPAIGVAGALVFGGELTLSGRHSEIPAIPATDSSFAAADYRMSFTIQPNQGVQLWKTLRTATADDAPINVTLKVGYTAPTGHLFADVSLFQIRWETKHWARVGIPHFHHKEIGGFRELSATAGLAIESSLGN